MSTFLIPDSLLDELEKMMNSFWWGNHKDGRRSINWLSWRRMCIQKKRGGLGFRSLQLFNIALLGKWGWRLMHDNQSLVCQVLKARYFQNTSFLDASVGNNPSYVWRSIMEAKDLLKTGLRWRIGDGKSIKVFNDPWLRRDANFCINNVIFPIHPETRVSHLFKEGCKEWDVNKIRNTFDDEEANQILSIPLSSKDEPDKLIWHYSANGAYTVKSAYKLATSLTLDTTEVIVGDWNKLWRLKVPPKVQHLLWRIGRECLPTRDQLRSKGIEITGGCGLCGQQEETTIHLFENCPVAIDTWRYTSFAGLITQAATSVSSAADWLLSVLGNIQVNEAPNFAMIVYALWKERNDRCWRRMTKPPELILRGAMLALHDWSLASKIPTVHTFPDSKFCEGWHCPRGEFVKINSDVSFQTNIHLTGLGHVLLDNRGNFVAAKAQRIEGLLQVAEGEALSLYHSMRWAAEMGYEKVEFEVDSKIVHDRVHSNGVGYSELDSLVDLCKNFLRDNPSFSVNLISRKANCVADVVSRAAFVNDSPITWVELPSFVDSQLLVICNCQ